jgi:hypothetical protein
VAPAVGLGEERAGPTRGVLVVGQRDLRSRGRLAHPAIQPGQDVSSCTSSAAVRVTPDRSASTSASRTCPALNCSAGREARAGSRMRSESSSPSRTDVASGVAQPGRSTCAIASESSSGNAQAASASADTRVWVAP